MAVENSDLDYYLGQLAEVGDLSYKKMFGGVGFYHQDLIFGLLAHGKLYLKVDDSNRDDFLSYQMSNFDPKNTGKGMPYYEVPQEILNNPVQLAKWAMKSYQVHFNSK